MAEARQVPTNQNTSLIREIERIAFDKKHIARGGKPDYAGLGYAAGKSRNLLNATLSGGEPKAETLLLIARYGGVNPLRLYRAAGWMTDADIAAMCVDSGATDLSPGERLRRAVEDEGVTQEQWEQMVRMLLGIAAQLEETDRQQNGDAPEPTTPRHSIPQPSPSECR